MGFETYDELLQRLVDARDARYPSDPEWVEARVNTMESVLQTVLEKLRDKFERNQP